MDTVLAMNPGDVLQVGRFSRGARAYLTVRGGFCVPKIMGSRSTYAPAAIGGFAGRPLQRGDSLRVGTGPCTAARTRKAWTQPGIEYFGDRNTLRVLRGPHVSDTGEPAFRSLLSAHLRVSDQSDRAGIRLTCEPLPQLDVGNMITEAMPCGAIQLTREGLPVILGVDRPTTGGYPILATVIAADWPALGQLRPRTEIRLVECSIEAARIAAAEEQRRLDELLPPNPAHGTTEGNGSF
jgi:antagonist of KipI